MSINSFPTSSQCQSSKPQSLAFRDRFHNAVVVLFRRPAWLHRVHSSLALYLYIFSALVRNFHAHIVALSSKERRSISLGLVHERIPTAGVLPCERIEAQKDGIDKLLAKYPWATALEGKLFLEGFDTGVEWRERSCRRDGSELLE
jgi:hypothetical protein